MDAVIGIEVEAADRAAWEAATFSFRRAFGHGVGTKALGLAPANDEAAEAAADPPPGWCGVP